MEGRVVRQGEQRTTSRIADMLITKMVNEQPQWMDQGSCVADRSVDHMYSEHREQALQVCVGCPVLVQCREYTESREVSFGVWAGVEFGIDEG